MKYFTQSMTLLGHVTEVDPHTASFKLCCRSGDVFTVKTSAETSYGVLRNLDNLDYDRVITPTHVDPSRSTEERVRKYIRQNEMVAVQGVYLEHEEQNRFDARIVTLMHHEEGRYLFEDTHWWLTQIALMADEWLDDLFQDRRTYQWDDFAALYRTNLNILGQPSDDRIQECATLSRLIYGLSSAYLLTGSKRYLLAASAGVRYQRETFRSLSHDGQYCFWIFGKRKRDVGTHRIVASENPDDAGSIPLYEQIYALAGLAQYYRITQEWEVLGDIRRTVRTFQDFYLDDIKHKGHRGPGAGGYFSHLDYATLRPDTIALGDNRLRKNWNSIGDHIPAYLINLILALDPIPRDAQDRERMEDLLDTCRQILDQTSLLIRDHFPDGENPYVNERFNADWTPDHNWRWQKNRAIVGHNLKIAWNLTRVASYYRTLSQEPRKHQGGEQKAQEYAQYADSLMDLATRLGDVMALHGIDQIRGGCFDAVERQPSDHMPIEFAWSNTKDFWQQEQAILAYLILYGWTRNQKYLDLAREIMAFWNLFFLDHDNRGIFFRVNDNGSPVIQGAYSQKAGHAVAGYHSFELNYLAHIYISAFVPTKRGEGFFPEQDRNFVLFFRPDKECGHKSINVLPDFVQPGTLEIASITVNGVARTNFDRENFQVGLSDGELGCEIAVEFCPKERHQ